MVAARGGARFRERLLLPPVLQWAVRVVAVVLFEIIVYGVAIETASPWERVLGLALGAGVTGLLLTLHGWVEVTDGMVRLGLFPLWRTELTLHEVAATDRVAVRPLPQMGVLGLGRVGGATVLALRSGDAVRLTMRDGRKYAVILQRSDDLLAAIRAARPDL